jgi:PST family polysaccharide transporter
VGTPEAGAGNDNNIHRSQALMRAGVARMSKLSATESAVAPAASEASVGSLVARSVGWVVLDRWGTRCISLAMLVVLGRLLVPADFGLVSLASLYVSFVGMFVEQGFARALIQRAELRQEHIDTAFWMAVGVGVVLTTATVVAAGWLAHAINLPDLAPVLRWLSLGLLFNAFSAIPAALLERSFDFKSLAIRRMASTLIGGIAAVIVALKGGGVWSLVVQVLTSWVVGIFVLWSASSWRPRANFSVPALRELWPVGSGILGIDILTFAGSEADRLVVGAFLGAEALGLYFMAMRIVTIMLEIFSSIFSGVAMSMFSRLQNDREQLRHWLYRLTRASSAVTVPCFALAAGVAPVALPLVIGPQWTSSVLIFQVLCLLGALNAVAWFDRTALVATGQARTAFLMALGQTILGLILVVGAAPLGVMAVAIAVVARQYLYMPVRVWTMKRAIGVRARTYVVQWLRPGIAALMLFVMIIAAQGLLPGFADHAVLVAIAVAIPACALYVAMMRWQDPELFRELISAVPAIWRGIR